MDKLHLSFRRVSPDDKARVLAFTERTWDDGDYIQHVFDEWQADPGGQFTAAVLDAVDAARGGQVVAIGKLTDLGEGELWLEGLRVDPAHRQKGIGQALHTYLLDQARRLGGRVLRYATGQNNAASHALGARTGFWRAGDYRWHAAEPSAVFPPAEPLTEGDQAALVAWLDSPLLRASGGLYQWSWRWGALSESRLVAHLRAGEVFGLRSESGLKAWAICALREDWEEAPLYHLDGVDHASLVAMARAVRRRAADGRRKKVETFAPVPSPLLDALPEAGYRSEELNMIVFESPLE